MLQKNNVLKYEFSNKIARPLLRFEMLPSNLVDLENNLDNIDRPSSAIVHTSTASNCVNSNNSKKYLNEQILSRQSLKWNINSHLCCECKDIPYAIHAFESKNMKQNRRESIESILINLNDDIRCIKCVVVHLNLYPFYSSNSSIRILEYWNSKCDTLFPVILLQDMIEAFGYDARLGYSKKLDRNFAFKSKSGMLVQLQLRKRQGRFLGLTYAGYMEIRSFLVDDSNNVSDNQIKCLSSSKYFKWSDVKNTEKAHLMCNSIDQYLSHSERIKFIVEYGKINNVKQIAEIKSDIFQNELGMNSDMKSDIKIPSEILLPLRTKRKLYFDRSLYPSPYCDLKKLKLENNYINFDNCESNYINNNIRDELLSLFNPVGHPAMSPMGEFNGSSELFCDDNDFDRWYQEKILHRQDTNLITFPK